MESSTRPVMDLKPLFNKLGNKLEEIRVRALSSLLSKLEHRLVCEADLVQERHLLIRLLEWFNFPKCSHQEQVLQLIHALTKHVSAASLVLEIGGVEFLTQLRSNADPCLHGLIDRVLDQLFHLPSSPPALQHSAACIYRAGAQEPDPPGHTHSYATNQSSSSAWSSDAGYLQQSGSMNPVSSLCVEMVYPSPQTIPTPPESQAGYFGTASHGSTPRTQCVSLGASAACFKFSTLPWIALMPTDRHVLSSTDMSLQKTDLTHVVSACEFLSDVVFQDFPAEVFLQRPSIVKSLLSLLDVRCTGGVEVSLSAVQALRDLSVSLAARICFYQDPALYTPKQDFSPSRHGDSSVGTMGSLSQSLGSSDTRPSLVGRSAGVGGDAHDGHLSPASSPPGGPDLDYEDMGSLQFTQWSLPQYTTAVLHRVAPMLASPSLPTVTTSLRLLQQM